MLWSGGLDSTYLLQKNLEKGNQVTAVYVKLENNDQWKAETAAIEKIYKILYHDFPDQLRLIKGDHYFVSNICEGGLMLQQVPGHIMYLLHHLKSYIDEVQVGYVCGDHAVSFVEDFRKIWRAYAGLFPGDKIQKLTFPLIKTTKEEVWDCLNPKLEPLISFCDHPNRVRGNTFSACGVCESCVRMREMTGMYPPINDMFFKNLKDGKKD